MQTETARWVPPVARVALFLLVYAASAVVPAPLLAISPPPEPEYDPDAWPRFCHELSHRSPSRYLADLRKMERQIFQIKRGRVMVSRAAVERATRYAGHHTFYWTAPVEELREFALEMDRKGFRCLPDAPAAFYRTAGRYAWAGFTMEGKAAIACDNDLESLRARATALEAVRAESALTEEAHAALSRIRDAALERAAELEAAALGASSAAPQEQGAEGSSA